MSFIDSYSIKAMAEQRQRDILAEAAGNRLAAVARNNRTAWWRHVPQTASRALSWSRTRALSPSKGGLRQAQTASSGANRQA